MIKSFRNNNILERLFFLSQWTASVKLANMKFFIIIIASVFISENAFAEEERDKYKLVCYYGSWASYREKDGLFTSDSIDPHLCTHVIYAYTGVSSDGAILILDKYLSLPDNWGKDDFRKFLDVKKYNPELKMMVGIGGFSEGGAKFSRVAATPQARQNFINSVVKFLNTYNFDGVSVDWMYPGESSTSDKQNFVLLLKELRQAIGNNCILSIVGSADKKRFDRGYDVKGIMKYVDFVNLLSYDYHGGWENVTGLNAPLYNRRSEPYGVRKVNQEGSVFMWLSKGMDQSKLVLGIPTYGRSWILQDINHTGVGASAIGPGEPGPYTQRAGLLGYNELVQKFKSESEWIVDFDNGAKVPYAHKGNLWISFDDEKSVATKASFIVNMYLGGAMIWSLETDDFRGIFGENFGLTNAVKKAFDSETNGTWLPPKRIAVPVTRNKRLTPSPEEIGNKY